VPPEVSAPTAGGPVDVISDPNLALPRTSPSGELVQRRKGKGERGEQPTGGEQGNELKGQALIEKFFESVNCRSPPLNQDVDAPPRRPQTQFNLMDEIMKNKKKDFAYKDEEEEEKEDEEEDEDAVYNRELYIIEQLYGDDREVCERLKNNLSNKREYGKLKQTKGYWIGKDK
jgi:hypothetical protein